MNITDLSEEEYKDLYHILLTDRHHDGEFLRVISEFSDWRVEVSPTDDDNASFREFLDEIEGVAASLRREYNEDSHNNELSNARDQLFIVMEYAVRQIEKIDRILKRRKESPAVGFEEIFE